MSDEAGRYSLNIRWSEPDQLYIAEVPELPGCQTHGATYKEVAVRAQEAIATWIHGHRAAGYPVPPPRVCGDQTRAASKS